MGPTRAPAALLAACLAALRDSLLGEIPGSAPNLVLATALWCETSSLKAA